MLPYIAIPVFRQSGFRHLGYCRTRYNSKMMASGPPPATQTRNPLVVVEMHILAVTMAPGLQTTTRYSSSAICPAEIVFKSLTDPSKVMFAKVKVHLYHVMSGAFRDDENHMVVLSGRCSRLLPLGDDIAVVFRAIRF